MCQIIIVDDVIFHLAIVIKLNYNIKMPNITNNVHLKEFFSLFPLFEFSISVPLICIANQKNETILKEKEETQ